MPPFLRVKVNIKIGKDRTDPMTRSEPKSQRERPGELRSFGRTRTRSLTARQQEIIERITSRIEIDATATETLAPSSLFKASVDEVWIEIGFGGGEHLLWQARQNTNIGLIGCEPFRDGVVKVLSAIDEEDINNIRLLADDARPLLRRLEPGSIARAFILFPDPWPKKRHNKRRLINTSLLKMLATVMRPGAELRIATDIDDYLKSILLTLQQSNDFEWLVERPADWRQRPSNWPPTRYEAKALREGRNCAFLRFRRK